MSHIRFFVTLIAAFIFSVKYLNLIQKYDGITLYSIGSILFETISGVFYNFYIICNYFVIMALMLHLFMYVITPTVKIRDTLKL